MSDTTSMIELKKEKRDEDILACKIDKLEKAKLEKEILVQKQHDQKTGLLKSTSKIEVLCGSKKAESDIKVIFKNQIIFLKHILFQNQFTINI